MSTWTSDFELEPAQSRRPSELGFGIRDTKTFVRSRWENEHTSYTSKGGNSGGTITADFVHKAGSARAYYQSTTPTVRPDGSTTLGTGDAGRLWFDSANNVLYTWSGSSWIYATQNVLDTFYVKRPGTSPWLQLRISVLASGAEVSSETAGVGPRPLLLNQFGSWTAVAYNSWTDPGATFFVNGTARVASTLSVQGGLNFTGLGSRTRTSGSLPPGGTYTIPAGTYIGHGSFLQVRDSNGNWDHGSLFIVSDGSNVRFYNNSSEITFPWNLTRIS